jgi:hypothetical protein
MNRASSILLEAQATKIRDELLGGEPARPQLTKNAAKEAASQLPRLPELRR